MALDTLQVARNTRPTRYIRERLDLRCPRVGLLNLLYIRPRHNVSFPPLDSTWQALRSMSSTQGQGFYVVGTLLVVDNCSRGYAASIRARGLSYS